MNTHMNEIKYTTTYTSKEQLPAVLFKGKWNLGTNKFNEIEVCVETPDSSKLYTRSNTFAVRFLEVQFVCASEQQWWTCSVSLMTFRVS
jgi:hypothetical protein